MNSTVLIGIVVGAVVLYLIWKHLIKKSSCPGCGNASGAPALGNNVPAENRNMLTWGVETAGRDDLIPHSYVSPEYYNSFQACI